MRTSRWIRGSASRDHAGQALQRVSDAGGVRSTPTKPTHVYFTAEAHRSPPPAPTARSGPGWPARSTRRAQPNRGPEIPVKNCTYTMDGQLDTVITLVEGLPVLPARPERLASVTVQGVEDLFRVIVGVVEHVGPGHHGDRPRPRRGHLRRRVAGGRLPRGQHRLSGLDHRVGPGRGGLGRLHRAGQGDRLHRL